MIRLLSLSRHHKGVLFKRHRSNLRKNVISLTIPVIGIFQLKKELRLLFLRNDNETKNNVIAYIYDIFFGTELQGTSQRFIVCDLPYFSYKDNYLYFKKVS